MLRYNNKYFNIGGLTRHEFVIDLLDTARNVEIAAYSKYAAARIITTGNPIEDIREAKRLNNAARLKARSIFYMEHGPDFNYPGKWRFQSVLSHLTGTFAWLLLDDRGMPTNDYAFVDKEDVQKITFRPIVPNPFPLSSENAGVYCAIHFPARSSWVDATGTYWKDSPHMLRTLANAGCNLLEHTEDE